MDEKPEDPSLSLRQSPIQKASEWLTFASNIAVLIGVVFVALELQQNTATVKAAAAAASQDSLATLNEQMASQPQFAEIVLQAGAEGFSSLPPLDAIQLSFAMRAVMQRFESLYFQCQRQHKTDPFGIGIGKINVTPWTVDESAA